MVDLIGKSLWVGLRRRWVDGLLNGFGAVGVTWTLTEVLTRAIPHVDTYLDTHGADYLLLMAALFVGVFLSYIYEPHKVTFKVPTTDTMISLKYGDLFLEDANLLIGVNEFFDGELGQPVAKTSLHGQFILRNHQASSAAFRAAVDPALAATGVKPRSTRRSVEPRSAYPIGTTAFVPNGQRRAFLMAMARSDIRTFKASSDVPTLWEAMKGGLQAVHDHGNGDALALPLFGNGQSGINLKPQHLLRLVVLALVDFGRNSKSQLPKQVTIVLHERCFDELDIREIARDWMKV